MYILAIILLKFERFLYLISNEFGPTDVIFSGGAGDIAAWDANIYGRPYWCSKNTFPSEIAAPSLCSAIDTILTLSIKKWGPIKYQHG